MTPAAACSTGNLICVNLDTGDTLPHSSRNWCHIIIFQLLYFSAGAVFVRPSIRMAVP